MGVMSRFGLLHHRQPGRAVAGDGEELSVVANMQECSVKAARQIRFVPATRNQTVILVRFLRGAGLAAANFFMITCGNPGKNF